MRFAQNDLEFKGLSICFLFVIFPSPLLFRYWRHGLIFKVLYLGSLNR